MKPRIATLHFRLRLLFGLMCLCAVPAGAQDACPAAPFRGGECWTTEDVIDDRIDHHAQSAMLRMFARGGTAAEDASAMLCAVKTRQLDGIYLPDQGTPARRAEAAGTGWWLIIPQGSASACYKQPAGEAPLIAFARRIKDDRDALGSALSEAWGGCGISPAAPRCYVATFSKPEPPPKEKEPCTDLFDCSPSWPPERILAACGTYECVDVPGDSCGVCVTPPDPMPWCSAPGECIVGLGAGDYCSDGSECVPLPGAEKYDYSCGVCASSEHKECIEKAWDDYNKEVEACNQKEKEEFPGCAAKMVKCAASVVGGAASSAFADCVKSAGCILGGPSHRRFKCGGEAEGRKRERLEKCKRVI